MQKEAPRKDKEEENGCQTPRKNTNVYISVSPRIFRKNIYHTHKLQREIIVQSKDNSMPIEFDPGVDRKPPLYLDIPNLYKRKRQELIKKVNICYLSRNIQMHGFAMFCILGQDQKALQIKL